MTLSGLDWTIIIVYLAACLLAGLLAARRAGKSSAEFFLSGRNMPWWLLGTSMVATTFSAGTPNLVTDIVRQRGVAGNWVWWSFLLGGMLTVFVYAKLWRRSGVMTDLEFYELRYSGGPAAFLRGFRALYLGGLFNIIVIASANLAAIKVAGALVGTTPVQTIVWAGAITMIYSMIGGLTGVLVTDLLQFTVAMGGAIFAAVYILNLDCIGGLSGMLAHEAVCGKIAIFPDPHDHQLLLAVFIIPLAVQWWSVWYPGSEPGGGGYIAQRMLAAKSELHATGATLWFNVAHYALRPWPWIAVALASLIIFPDLAALESAFPHMQAHVVKHDLAYPAMLTMLPSGLRGVVFGSLMAAYMSTLSTQLNLGSSYLVNDFYKRFVRPAAPERELVLAGRVAIVLLMLGSALLGLWLSSALQVFDIILQIGAGTGLLFLLRWFWWRINAYSEIAAMAVSFLVAIGFQYFEPGTFPSWLQLVIGVAITTVAWMLVTFLTQPTDEAVLRRFYRELRPGGPGWGPVVRRTIQEGDCGEDPPHGSNLPGEILCATIGCVVVYSALVGIGYWIYGYYAWAAALTTLAVVGAGLLLAVWSRIQTASARWATGEENRVQT